MTSSNGTTDQTNSTRPKTTETPPSNNLKAKSSTLFQVVSTWKSQPETPQERPSSDDLDAEPNLYREDLDKELQQDTHIYKLPETENFRNAKTKSKGQETHERQPLIYLSSASQDPMEEVPPHIRVGITCTAHQKKLRIETRQSKQPTG
ncbi:hypothetical protein Bca4012_002033 [Brassica carinata]|uniref:Uncharacterized protein n=1 Tax=Brassica carinata TaxID=52824 RepID=A0A8X7S0L9_BRACI|nr:hypothetical protein Bca52824_043139 [Brassica carinata]